MLLFVKFIQDHNALKLKNFGGKFGQSCSTDFGISFKFFLNLTFAESDNVIKIFYSSAIILVISIRIHVLHCCLCLCVWPVFSADTVLQNMII